MQIAFDAAFFVDEGETAVTRAARVSKKYEGHGVMSYLMNHMKDVIKSTTTAAYHVYAAENHTEHALEKMKRARYDIVFEKVLFCIKFLFQYMYPIIKREVCDSILIGLTLPHMCSWPKLGAWISTSYVVVFFCVQQVQLRREAVVRFVDISGIDDHHCLNFLFINISFLMIKTTSTSTTLCVSYILVFPIIISIQGRIQDFKLGGGVHLKNCAERREARQFWGISCEKSRFYAKKSYIFQI